jgi:hypothetical protein
MTAIIGKGRYGRETYQEARPVIPPNPGDGGSPTLLNKSMPAQTTASDGDLACTTGVAQTPVVSTDPQSGYVGVDVFGKWEHPGNGTKNAACYFSRDGGTTAVTLRSVMAGDLLYWNGSIAGYELEAGDLVSFHYNV